MSKLDYRGILVHFVEDGDSESDARIVMLHAGASSVWQWRKIAPHFPEHRVITPDLLGFGETEAWPGPGVLTLDNQAEIVLQVMNTVNMSSAIPTAGPQR